MADYTLTARLTTDARQMIRGFGSAQNSLSDLQKSVRDAGNRINDIGKSVKGVGNNLTKGITLPAMGAASALAGIALVKGWTRLTGIDNAQAKLKGLGHDAESVKVIMNSALDSVRGTAFGMDEAATTAASAVAAGIKPGKDLTKYLGLTGDAAAIAGVSLGEMGAVINKVQTSQVAYTDNLNQLADRGIPIYQWLAKEAGVAQSEVADMASQGKISSEMFLAAIEKNIGGAAKTMGESSFTAAVSNIGASFGRIGANFLDAGGQAGGFFSTVKPLLTDFNNSLSGVEAMAADLGVKFGESFNQVLDKARELKTRFDELSAPMQGMIMKGAAIGAAIAVGIGPALMLVGTLIAVFGSLVSAVALVFSPIGLVVAAIAALGVAVGLAMIRSEEFRNTVIGAFTMVSGVISGIVSTIAPILQNLFTGALDGANGFADGLGGKLLGAFETVKSVVMTVVGVIGQFVSAIVNGFSGAGGSVSSLSALFLGFNPVLKIAMLIMTQFGPQIAAGFQQIAGLVVPIVQTLGTMLGQLAATIIPIVMGVVMELVAIIVELGGILFSTVISLLPIVMNLFNSLVPIIMMVVQQLGAIITVIVPLVANLVKSLFPAISMIAQVLMNIVTAVAPAFIAVVGLIGSALAVLLPIISSILQAVIHLVTNIIKTVMPLVGFIGGVISGIIAVIAPIITFIAGVMSSIFQLIRPIVDVVTGVFNTVMQVVSDVWQRIMTYTGSIFISLGTIISGLSGVVSGVFNAIFGTISSIMDNVSKKITGVFEAIRGAWKGLTTFVDGIFNGISSNVEKLVNQVKGFVNDVIGGINSAVSLINKIPGVNISPIPYLARGTDDWQGGFARINEGGRGELVNLPGGSQVIPHDVSMKYAREAGYASARDQSSQSDSNAAGVVYNQSVTLNSPRHLSASENARKIKKVSREIAMNW